MANSKNTKQDRDEKKSSDLSELNNYSSESENDFESKSAHPEFTSQYSSSKGNDEDKNRTSAYASKINKSFGGDAGFKNRGKGEENDEYSYTSQLGNDQRDSSKESFRSSTPYQSSGRTHQLSYDQQFRSQQPQYQQPQYQQPQYQQPYNGGYNQYQG